jgi:putative SOS response-associated peptidase YedK
MARAGRLARGSRAIATAAAAGLGSDRVEARVEAARAVVQEVEAGVGGWKSIRKVKEGEVEADLFAFLTTEPNAEVGSLHPKAMPVVLTEPEEIETWMTAPAADVLALQRPLPDGALRIVARGRKMDGDV